tara:strand:+ start:40748 stop:42673 length:1926 start_codon:yes stop_codon:yes gene_type:complete
MLLENFKAQGFRRLELENNLQLSGKLVAIVGPNEAGKTSVLQAISHFSHTQPISEFDKTHFSASKPKLKLSFFLEDDDLAEAGLVKPTWFHVVKNVDGDLSYAVNPVPVRDVNKRKPVAEIFRRLTTNPKIKKHFESEELALNTDEIADIIERLQTLDSELDAGTLEDLNNLSEVYDNIDQTLLPKYAAPLREALTDLISHETSIEPYQHAVNVLANRMPEILMFGPQDRDLQIPFDLNRFEHTEPARSLEPSKPLTEILRLSGLNLTDLKAANAGANNAVVAGLLEAANLKLKEISKGIWSQSDAHLYFTIKDHQLDLLVKNEKEFAPQDRFNNFERRSDGYKQFIALQVFSFLKSTQNPILLIDEIEQHLHYDAQADLIQLLQRDPNIKKVIYTTHSAGCLPEDLGVGVRLVQWDKDNKKRSKIINRFWFQNDEDGFRPMLFGMGATTMAFFPTRKALIGEGPTELLLLPRLLREALGLENLEFQVVHGLSCISPSGLPMMDGLTDGIAYIVDEDQAGKDLANNLVGAKVPQERIFSVGDGSDATTLEDMIDEKVWLLAVNRYVEQYGERIGITERLVSAPSTGRINALPKPLQKQKVNFAYNIIEQTESDPNLKIISSGKRQAMKVLGQNIRKALDLS